MAAGVATTAYAADFDWSGVNQPTAEDLEKSSSKYLRIGVIDESNLPASNNDSFSMLDDDQFKIIDEFYVGEDVTLSSQQRFYIFYSSTDGDRDYRYLATRREIGRWDIDVIVKSGDTHGEIVKEVEIGYHDLELSTGDTLPDAAYIEVTLQDYLDATGKKAFEIEVQLTSDGKKLTGSELKIKGDYENAVTEVYDSDTEIYLTDPAERLVEAMDSISATTVELACDVFIDTRMFKGKKYYGRAENDGTLIDYDLISKYSFDEVVNLYTIGLAIDGDCVTLANRPEYYVYCIANEDAYYDADSAELLYLGRSGAKLPYRTKYLLSTTELQLEADTPPEPELPTPEQPEVPLENPIGGGDSTPNPEPIRTPNPNYNPPTGH